MIRIVTIEREYGSGGGEIAQLLAKHLGWKLWDQDLTEEIARLANCPKAVVEVREERTDPLYYRLFKSFLRGSYEGSLNAHKLNVVDSESILKITERVVQHATFGNLQNAFAVDDVEFVRIQASFITAAQEGFEEPVIERIGALLTNLDDGFGTIGQPGDLFGQVLIPKLPAQVLGEQVSDFAAAASVFAF